MYEYLNTLNEPQRDAVENINGPSLIIAGAGSGKTRVLTYRIAHLLNMGAKPSSVLSLTFTNKAAKEMRNRISAVIGEEKAKAVWMGTFHSIFAKILRYEADALGFTSSFVIHDQQDAKNMLKSVIKELHLSDQVYKVNEVQTRISWAKNNLLSSVQYAANIDLVNSDASAKKPYISEIYKLYTQRCFKSNVMDFDDLLLYTNILLAQRPDILRKYQNRFKYILVDEYQDTNYAQYLIVRRLSSLNQNITVVGDDAQSIYSFRGAKIENILNFKKDYPECKVFKIEQNYRSTQTIVNAASSVISLNVKQLKKNVFSENEVGDKIKLLETINDNEEGYAVANAILEQRLINHYAFKDFGILYRTNSQSRILEEALRRRNIPYKIYGGLSFYQRKEIKDLLAYFRLVINKNDDESFKRIINYPKRGIGDTTVEKLEVFAHQNDVSIWDVIVSPHLHQIGLGAATANKILGFVAMINLYTEKKQRMTAYELATEIANTSGVVKDLYIDKTPEGVSRHENVQELLNGILEFSNQEDVPEEERTLDIFLQDIALLTNDDKDTEEDRNRVSLMTVHSSKGLEFKNVFLVGLEEELFPPQTVQYRPEDLEEERRLFYVAVTRAEKNLTISFARQRFRFGNLKFSKPSRFISEIEERYLDFSNVPSFRQQVAPGEEMVYTRGFGHLNTPEANIKKDPPVSLGGPTRFNPNAKPKEPEAKPIGNGYRSANMKPIGETSQNYNFNVADLTALKEGSRVEHQKFGPGRIVAIEGNGPDLKAKIDFGELGDKTLLLKFAKLKIIE